MLQLRFHTLSQHLHRAGGFLGEVLLMRAVHAEVRHVHAKVALGEGHHRMDVLHHVPPDFWREIWMEFAACHVHGSV